MATGTSVAVVPPGEAVGWIVLDTIGIDGQEAIMHAVPNPGPDPNFRIVHTTDFTGPSQTAFIHALKLALAAGAELDLVHVSQKSGEPDWAEFPGVRQTLGRWGVHESGLRIGKIVAVDSDPARAALKYVGGRPTELVVLATRQRRGMDRWLHKATAEPIARESGTITLFLPRRGAGFVSPDTGGVSLQRVLVPVDHNPAPQAAAEAVDALLRGLGCPGGTVRILHVGEEHAMPQVRMLDQGEWRWEVSVRSGDPVDEIVAAATEWAADLIVMTTQGHTGVLDALRGSTTERILRRASCPVLAVPAGSRAMRRLFRHVAAT
jgi:nucleotide-binding universal stress UspA family protein